MTSWCCRGRRWPAASPPARLVKLDKSRLPNARAVQPAVSRQAGRPTIPAARYSLAFGWAPFGLLFDADKVAARLGGAADSWSSAADPRDVA